jgi:hypothetical protein
MEIKTGNRYASSIVAKALHTKSMGINPGVSLDDTLLQAIKKN